jgi:uncharacterized protein
MKTTVSLVAAIFFSIFSLLTENAYGINSTPSLEGIWLGKLEMPNQINVRIGITFTSQSNNSILATLNIIEQATGDIPCEELICRNDSIFIRMNKLGIEVTGYLNKESGHLTCELSNRGTILPIVFSRVEVLPRLNRPQEPEAPFPYMVEEVIFENKDAGIKLAGTITLPENANNAPAVILVTGSGKQNRDEEFAGHKPFMVIADHLTRKGIVVLRYDDRGVGGSSGNFDQSSTGDFATDALSAIRYLQGRKEVNPCRVGIIGHSEGGIVASLVAHESADVAFIVSLAGFVVNFEEAILGQLSEQLRQRGKNEDDIDLERALRKKIYSIVKENIDSVLMVEKLWSVYDELSEEEVARLNWPKARHESQIKQVMSPWWHYNLCLDNHKMLMAIKCPVLALYGELDKQVIPGQNIPFVEEAFKNGGNSNFEIMNLSGLNHMFQKANTGEINEYIKIEETISPIVLDIISDWVEKTIEMI